MNSVARWFVNHLAGRRHARLYARLRAAFTLPPASVCLEIGCGNGEMAVRLFEGMGPARLVATDVDLDQIETATRRARAHFGGTLPTGLELRPADMTRLPFPDAGFDAVFAFSSLHHAGTSHRDTRALSAALAEVDRVLRPEGYLAYEEFLHKKILRKWLEERGYTPVASERGWRRELVVARKPVAAAPIGTPRGPEVRGSEPGRRPGPLAAPAPAEGRLR